MVANPERIASITDDASRHPTYPCASWLQRIKRQSMRVLKTFATSHLSKARFKQLPVTTVECQMTVAVSKTETRFLKNHAAP